MSNQLPTTNSPSAENLSYQFNAPFGYQVDVPLDYQFDSPIGQDAINTPVPLAIQSALMPAPGSFEQGFMNPPAPLPGQSTPMPPQGPFGQGFMSPPVPLPSQSASMPPPGPFGQGVVSPPALFSVQSAPTPPPVPKDAMEAHEFLQAVRWEPTGQTTGMPQNASERQLWVDYLVNAFSDVKFVADARYNRELHRFLPNSPIKWTLAEMTAVAHHCVAKNVPTPADTALNFSERLQALAKYASHFKKGADQVLCMQYIDTLMANPLRAYEEARRQIENLVAQENAQRLNQGR
ncbi:hypothetical protein EJ04DRAFT_527406 [Polyplosphaeria fusca]|uniref:Uncharacterized protein n=1 Tax=Polyplosphaeria fusca TaxID=682080 RepID=A0A9P4QNU5_9PLEO|nr:hypothetical protein EJ04DRAFT_527406 [Polyplosphaeria fusca]